jgi:hypothetical protein
MFFGLTARRCPRSRTATPVYSIEALGEALTQIVARAGVPPNSKRLVALFASGGILP